MSKARQDAGAGTIRSRPAHSERSDQNTSTRQASTRPSQEILDLDKAKTSQLMHRLLPPDYTLAPSPVESLASTGLLELKIPRDRYQSALFPGDRDELSLHPIILLGVRSDDTLCLRIGTEWNHTYKSEDPPTPSVEGTEGSETVARLWREHVNDFSSCQSGADFKRHMEEWKIDDAVTAWRIYFPERADSFIDLLESQGVAQLF